jgi:hypothetical protein
MHALNPISILPVLALSGCNTTDAPETFRGGGPEDGVATSGRKKVSTRRTKAPVNIEGAAGQEAGGSQEAARGAVVKEAARRQGGSQEASMPPMKRPRTAIVWNNPQPPQAGSNSPGSRQV